MSTQTRNSGGGRNQKKSNSGNGGGGGGGGDSVQQTSHKKADVIKTEKEKSHPKPTAEQLRIAQITNSSTSEDPQMCEKVATLIEMTQRSEEDVCCALNECDNNLDNAALYLLETLPVGAFETSSKKKKNKAANTALDGNTGGGDGDWDGNANVDKREKSRSRIVNSTRGGRTGSDSRGWRGREARENERNARGGADREDRTNDNYRGNQRGNYEGRRGAGGSRGGGYMGRGGRGNRMGGGRGGPGGRGDRSGSYGSRYNNTGDDHQEVELWDNTIAQNAEKQQQQSQDDAWGDWDNEEYVGSLKDSKVFTTSNLPNQTAASVLSSGLAGSGSVSGSGATTTSGGSNDLSASSPLADHHHLGTSVIGSAVSPSQSSGSHINTTVGSSVTAPGLDDNSTSNMSSVSAPPLMQYSAAVSSTAQVQQPQQQSSVVGTNSALTSGGGNSSSTKLGPQYVSNLNSFSAAMNIVQQVEQMKSSTTLSAEQSQYFNSLTSQNVAGQTTAVGSGVPQQQQQQQQQQQLPSTYAQNASSMQYPTSYANVFGSASGTGSSTATDNSAQIPLNQQPQVRRARAKLPPPSKIPSSAVEMPGDSLNNIGYLDVQFGGLDFGTDDSFENLSEKFNTSVNLDSQQSQQQQQQQQQHQQQKSLVQTAQDVGGSTYDQTKSVTPQQQQSLSSGLQNSHLADSLTASAYTQRSTSQQQQQQTQQMGSGTTQGVGAGSNSLDQLSKSDPYSQQNASSGQAYSSSYQSGTNVSNKGVVNSYQPSVSTQGYSNSAYGTVQSSVANSYQPQAYGSYQQNSMASYQQQQLQSVNQSAQTGSNSTGTSSVGSGTSATQNIPSVGGSNNSSSAAANSNSSYLSSAYGSQQNSYQSSQSVYGSTGLSNSAGFSGNANAPSSQYSNFSSSSKLKDSASSASNTSHYESVSSSNAISSSGTTANPVSSAVNSNNAVTNSNNSSNSSSSNSNVANNASSNVVSQTGTTGAGNANSSNSNANSSNAAVSGVSVGSSSSSTSAVSAVSSGVSSGSSKTGSVAGNSGAPPGAGASSGGSGSGMVPNIQMVSQYIQTSVPYYQQPVYSYEELQMMQQRVPHVGYYDLNYTPTSLGAGRDNLGSVAYSTMTDGRFTRTDNNSSPVSNVSSTMSQQAGSSGPMLNVPYYFYGGNVMPGNFQYGTPAIYPQIPAANTASGGKFPQPNYNTGYGSTNYDALTQASQDYSKGTYPSSVNQQTKSQNVTNPPQAGTTSDITSSMYGKGHVALNKVNSYDKQNFHSGTPPPFNMANAQTAGGTSAQPFGMFMQTLPAAGHHMMHPPIHQMDGRIHNSSRRDSNSTGQRQPTSSQSKSAAKQGYSPSYWTGQN